MQQKEESHSNPAQNEAAETPNHMATNPNTRANENIKGSTIDKDTSTNKDTTTGNAADVGSEITDGEAS